MILGFDTIKEITRGVSYIEQKDGKMYFSRFSPLQMKAYAEQTRSEDFTQKSYATSGVRLEFSTDSRTLVLEGSIDKGGSSRKFYYFDVYVNGALCAHLGDERNDSHDFSYSAELGEGKKDVVVYFPWTARTSLSAVSVDDGAQVCGAARKPIMLCYGDSITQGYDAFYPSLTYASILTDRMGVESLDKAIGGERFCPYLLKEAEDLDVKYVTVAYGTNDWSRGWNDEAKADCKDFYNRLFALYPNAKIFAITPIWREDSLRRESERGPFSDVAKYIASVCEGHANAYVIDGTKLTPHLPEFYSDKYLHPNDLGFLS